MGRLGIPLVLASVFVAAHLFAQGQVQPRPQTSPTPGPRPPRDTPARGTTAREPTGTARVGGTVISADTGAPLRGAVVRVMASDVRVVQIASTDANGRWGVSGLPAARYAISVTKSGYVSLQFGQRRPFESGRPLTVADGQVVEQVDFALPRGGVITGRLVDGYGEPVAGVRVDARRFQYLPSGGRQLIPSGAAGMITSDDRGQYRIYGLMPGSYVVYASPMGGMATVMPMAGGVVTTTSSSNEGYAATYFPGTANADEAQMVTVELGQEVLADFTLISTKLVRVSGVVRDSQGRPVGGAQVMVRPAGARIMGDQPSFAGTNGDGSFTMLNVAPGEHILEVRPRRGGRGGRGADPRAPEDDEFASMPLSVGGDLTDVLVTTSPGATIAGRVVFEGAASMPAMNQPLRIMATPADVAMPGGVQGPDSGIVGDAGEFQVSGVAGRVFFVPGQLPPGWALKRVTLAGRDLTDAPLDVNPGDTLNGLEVTLTNRLSSVTGSVRNPRGEPVNDYVVIVVPRQVREGVAQTRYVSLARPDQQGMYRISARLPGDYVALAVDSIDQGSLWDPAFQQHVRARGVAFSLREGDALTLDLELTQ